MRHASIYRIIRHDGAAWLLAVLGTFMFAMSCSDFLRAYGILSPLHQHCGPPLSLIDHRDSGITFAVIASVLFLLLFRRMARIKFIISNGPHTLATVSGTTHVKNGVCIGLTLAHNEQTQSAMTVVSKSNQAVGITVGDVVEVAINPDNPKQVLIVDLYVRTNPAAQRPPAN